MQLEHIDRYTEVTKGEIYLLRNSIDDLITNPEYLLNQSRLFVRWSVLISTLRNYFDMETYTDEDSLETYYLFNPTLAHVSLQHMRGIILEDGTPVDFETYENFIIGQQKKNLILPIVFITNFLNYIEGQYIKFAIEGAKPPKKKDYHAKSN